MKQRFAAMSPKKRLAFACGLAALILSSTLAFATTNTIVLPRTTAAESQFNVTADGLKPEQCSAVALTAVMSGDGVVDGTAANELLLAENTTTQLNGGDGDDCLVSAAGLLNILDGGNGNDVCIGGNLTDYRNCEMIVRQ